MSLVNDMLRDLDARQPKDDARADLNPSLPAASGGHGKGALAGGALLLVLAGFIGSFWLLQQPDHADASPVTQPPVRQKPAVAAMPMAHAEPVLAPSVAPVNDASTAVTSQTSSIPTSGVQGPSSAAASSAVQQLLSAAKQALADDRLTQPPVNNAYALYSHVLLLSPENADARNGIQQIQNRYAQLVNDAVLAGSLSAAEQYLKRAAFVGIAAKRLATLQELVAHAAQEPQRDAVAIAAAPEVAEPVNAQRASTEPQADTHVLIERSWPSREAEAVATANRFLQQGQHDQAIATLQPVVTGYADAEAAVLLLFDVYVQTGQVPAARALRSRSAGPVMQRYFDARLLAEAGQGNDALAVLEQQAPTGAVTEPWMALQAGLYQQTGANSRALTLYQHLVQLDNRQVKYWLGLAVSAEAAGDKGLARRAFITADQLQPANVAVSSYIKQRIQALSR